LRRLFLSKSHRALMPQLLLSKSNPLRWASIWFGAINLYLERGTGFFIFTFSYLVLCVIL